MSTYGVEAAAASDGMALEGAGLASCPDSHYVTARTLGFKSCIEFCEVQFVVSVSVCCICCLFIRFDQVKVINKPHVIFRIIQRVPILL